MSDARWGRLVCDKPKLEAVRGSFMLEGEKTNVEIYFTLSPESPLLLQDSGNRILTDFTGEGYRLFI
jgi:hypothetical protein